MKKYLFILGLVGTALLSACSADDLTTALSPEEERALIVEASQDSDVPITLGSVASVRSGMTRTPIESYGNFNTPTGANAPCLGVFCLASAKQASAPSSASGNWDDALATWLNNVPAKATTGDVVFLDPTTLTKETPTSRILYYPYGNWYYYNFYAYYPRITDATAISVGSNSVIVNYEIDGREDIIWGKTTAPAQAYCAQYFRNNPTEIPQFDEFEHKLAKLEVYVKGNSNFEVTSATISGVYKNLALCVASKTTSGINPTGNLSIKAGSVSGDLSLSKVNAGGVDVDPFAGGAITVLAAEEKYIGYVMIPPTALLGVNEKYTINLEINGTLKHVVLKNSVDDSRMEFVKGKSYKITLDNN